MWGCLHGPCKHTEHAHHGKAAVKASHRHHVHTGTESMGMSSTRARDLPLKVGRPRGQTFPTNPTRMMQTVLHDRESRKLAVSAACMLLYAATLVTGSMRAGSRDFHTPQQHTHARAWPRGTGTRERPGAAVRSTLCCVAGRPIRNSTRAPAAKPYAGVAASTHQPARVHDLYANKLPGRTHHDLALQGPWGCADGRLRDAATQRPRLLKKGVSPLHR